MKRLLLSYVPSILLADVVVYVVFFYYQNYQKYNMDFPAYQIWNFTLLVVLGFYTHSITKNYLVVSVVGILTDVVIRPATVVLSYLLFNKIGYSLNIDPTKLFIGSIFSSVIYTPVTISLSLLGAFFAKKYKRA